MSVLLTAGAVLPRVPDSVRRFAGRLPFGVSPEDEQGLQRCEPVVEVRHQPVIAGTLVRQDQHLGMCG